MKEIEVDGEDVEEDEEEKPAENDQNKEDEDVINKWTDACIENSGNRSKENKTEQINKRMRCLDDEKCTTTTSKNSGEGNDHIINSKRTKIEETRKVHEETPSKIQLKKGNRVRWNEQDKKIVLNYFKKHIKDKVAPRKEECLAFIKLKKERFDEHQWVRIKTLVYNTYRNQN